MMTKPKAQNASTQSKARRSFAIVLLLILFGTTVPHHAAIAGDTERLAQCIAIADLAAAAAKSRAHGIPAQQAKQAIASTDTPEAQLKEAIAIAYDGPTHARPGVTRGSSRVLGG